ncbi:MAG: porin [Burkholderiales bacterium]|nr:porin [Burkholderiales bacterium]
MNKKLLMAVAVAGALAAPGVALAAQHMGGGSSVTISGIFKMGYGQYKLTGGGVNRSNTSQDMVVDNSSRIIFGVKEDLGNGLQAIAQLDMRYQPDGGGLAGSGNDFVGLKSKTWGQLVLGRLDLHYGRLSDETASKAGALHAAAISLFDYMPNGATGANTAIANTTRTPNVIAYDTINFNGLSARIAYSTEPFAGENDMSVASPTVGTRTGSGWNFNPVYANGPLKVGYSYWDAKPDAPTATSVDQRGDTFYGSYKWGGFGIGLGYNRSRLDNSLGGAKNAERNAWSIPMIYNWGPHTVGGHYTKADDIKSDLAGVPGSTGADMFAIVYNYDFSKRTAMGITYAKIKNDTNAAYAFFTSTGALGSGNLAPFAGEDPQMVQVVVRHAF